MVWELRGLVRPRKIFTGRNFFVKFFSISKNIFKFPDAEIFLKIFYEARDVGKILPDFA